ncbi:MAG: Maf family protein [Gallionella sp.]
MSSSPFLYLASQSPRRRELLAQVGIAFEVLPLHHAGIADFTVDETPHANESPEIYVRRVCLEKARAGLAMVTARGLPVAPVLAADTSVVLGAQILGKADNLDHAAAMLRSLSGREHRVLSAVAVGLGDKLELALSTSVVRFAPLSEARIQAYLATGEYADKAGGYAIQGIASAFIANLSGSYSGVMGLPLFETVELLKQFDFATL